MGDEIGGHQVSGHVHTTAQVKQIEDTENNRRLTFEVSCGSAPASDLRLVYMSIASDHSVDDWLIQDGVSKQLCCHSLLDAVMRGLKQHIIVSAVHCTNFGLMVQVPKEWMKYILAKGFIAVDGCSLTVSPCAISMLHCGFRLQHCFQYA